MAFIQENDKSEVRKVLNRMDNPVELIMFTQQVNCQYCSETKQLLDELSELSSNLVVTEYNLVSDSEEVEQYHVDKAPAIVVKGEQDYGIRYYGIPSGYEFASLLEDIVDVSNGDPGFSAAQLEQISAIRQPVHLQVFVTPTCPYCPQAVRNAHRMAMVNPNITADMVEAQEFPELSQRYQVRGVPRTVVNGHFNIDGGLPEDAFIDKIIEQVGEQVIATA